ncbi:MAG: C1 family peptidase [Bdellovibrionota bacterium]
MNRNTFLLCSVILIANASLALATVETFDSLSKKLVHELPSQMIVPVRDQGTAGSCTDFVVTDLVLEHYLAKSPLYRGKTLSVSCLMGLRDWMFDSPSYTDSDKPTAKPSVYGEGPTVAQTVIKYGIPFAENYDALGIDCRDSVTDFKNISLQDYQKLFEQPPNPTTRLGQGLKVVIEQTPSFDFIRRLLDQNIPVAIGIVPYIENQKEAVWILNKNDPPWFPMGGHALQLIGYTNDGYFKFKNSWGEDWGQKGFGFVSEEFILYGWKLEPRLNYIGYISP